jgi:RNA polymerase sigma-70 factor, ECF subfamily
MADDADVVEALRRGDERTFRRVVMQYHPSLVRTACSFVPSRAVAEEVAQDTWLAVIRGLDNFEGRSSFKTWLFRILINQARTRGVREARTVPLSSQLRDYEPSVPADRFNPLDHPRWPRHWSAAPTDWGALPEAVLDSAETREVIDAAISALPPAQRDVITLRDIDGLATNEVCDVLSLSEGNQRVLLHRARSRVRAALEMHFEGVSAS